PVDLRLYRKGDWGPAANHVYLDAASGAVVSLERMADRPAGARFLAALAPIHYAQFGGRPVQILWSLFGLLPGLLFMTRLFTWWRPTAQKQVRSVVSEEECEERTLVH